MIVRVDTTNIARGLDFEVMIQVNTIPLVSLYAFNTVTYEVETLETNVSQQGDFFYFQAKAPYFDGFILVTINQKSIVAKKLGHPTPHFVVGYKSGFTVPYEIFNTVGELVKKDNLLPIVDGFYFCRVDFDKSILKTLGKRFIMKRNSTKFDYEVSLGDATLDEVALPEYVLLSTLGDATLDEVALQYVETNATLGNTTITG